MATVVRYVNPASTAGGDGTTAETTGGTRAYASVTEWEAAEDGVNLVSDGDIHECRLIGGTSDEAGIVSVTGWTTGASNYIWIHGHNEGGSHADGKQNGKHVDDGGAGFLLDTPETANHKFQIYEEYVRLEDFSIRGCLRSQGGSTTSDQQFTRLLIQDTVYASTGDYLLHRASGHANFTATNCVIGPYSWRLVLQDGGTNNVNTLEHCTIYGDGSNANGWQQDDAADFTYNTVSFNNSNNDYNNIVGGGTHNASEDTTANSYTSGVVSITPGDEFTDFANGDLSIDAGTATDLPGAGTYRIATDIVGNTRANPPTIGAFEAPAGSTETVTPAEAQTALTGKTPDAVEQAVVAPAEAQIALTGKVPNVAEQAVVAPAESQIALTGKVPAVAEQESVAPAEAQVALTGKTPNVAERLRATVAPTEAQIALTGKTPSVVEQAVVAPTEAQATLTGKAPDVAEQSLITVAPTEAQVALTGKAPVAIERVVVIPAESQVALTGKAPVAIERAVVIPAESQVALTGKAPVAIERAVVIPAESQVALTGKAPVAIERAVVIPAESQVALTGKAPAVAEQESVAPTEAQVALTGKALVAIERAVVIPAESQVALTGKAPVPHPEPNTLVGVEFGGTNEYVERATPPVGIADSKVGTLSFMYKPDAVGSVEYILETEPIGSTARLRVFMASAGTLTLAARDALGSVITYGSEDVVFTAGQYTRVIASWDLAADTLQVYTDDVARAGSIEILADLAVDYDASAQWRVGAGNDATPADHLDGVLAEFFFHTQYLDLDTESNRRKFFDAFGNPVSKGNKGETPLSAQPLVYLSGKPNDFYYNYGSGGAFVTSGALVEETLPVVHGTTPDKGALALTGKTPSLSGQAGVAPAKGDVTLTGKAVNLVEQTGVAPAKGDVTLAGKAPALGGQAGVAPAKGDVTLAGKAVNLVEQTGVAPAKGDVTLTGKAVNLVEQTGVAPAKGDVTLTGKAVNLVEQTGVAPAKGDVTLVGKAPALGGAEITIPAKGDLVLAGKISALIELIVVTPDNGALTLTGKALVLSGVGVTTPVKGDAVLAGKIASLVERAVVTSDKGGLTLVGKTPALSADVIVPADIYYRVYLMGAQL